MSEPESGRFNIIVRSYEDGEGIQRAIDSCPEGGSILLRGKWFRVKKTLRLNRSVHLFGRGKVTLDPCIPYDGDGATLIESTAASASIDGLKVDGEAESDYARAMDLQDEDMDDFSYFCVTSGRLRLQGCGASHSQSVNRANMLTVEGPTAHCDAIGCTFHGPGLYGVWFRARASGSVVGCHLRDFVSSGVALDYGGSGASPLVRVTRNTFSDCSLGVIVWVTADPDWALATGEGNTFINCTLSFGRNVFVPN